MMSFVQPVTAVNCCLLLANIVFHFYTQSNGGFPLEMPMPRGIRGLQELTHNRRTDNESVKKLMKDFDEIKSLIETLDHRTKDYYEFKSRVESSVELTDVPDFPLNNQRSLWGIRNDESGDEDTEEEIEGEIFESGENEVEPFQSKSVKTSKIKSGKKKNKLSGKDPNLKCFPQNNTCYTTSKYIFQDDVVLEPGRMIRADNTDTRLKCSPETKSCKTKSKYLFDNDLLLERGRRFRADLAQIRVIENALGKSVIATDNKGLRAFETYRLSVESAHLKNISDTNGVVLVLADPGGDLRVSNNLRMSANQRIMAESIVFVKEYLNNETNGTEYVGAHFGLDPDDELGGLRMTNNLRISGNRRIITDAIQFGEDVDSNGTTFVEVDYENFEGGLRVSNNMRISNNKRFTVDTVQFGDDIDSNAALFGIDPDDIGAGLRVTSNLRVSNNKRITVDTLQFGSNDDNLFGIDPDDIEAGLRVTNNLRVSNNKRISVKTLQFGDAEDLDGISVFANDADGLRVTNNMRVSSSKRLVANEAEITSFDVTLRAQSGSSSRRRRNRNRNRNRALAAVEGENGVPHLYRLSESLANCNNTVDSDCQPDDNDNSTLSRELNFTIKFNELVQQIYDPSAEGPSAPEGYTLFEEEGECLDGQGELYNFIKFKDADDAEACHTLCAENAGITLHYVGLNWDTLKGCYCLYDFRYSSAIQCDYVTGCVNEFKDGLGYDEVVDANGEEGIFCYKFDRYPYVKPTPGWDYIGEGICLDYYDETYDYTYSNTYAPDATDCPADCAAFGYTDFLRAITYSFEYKVCFCHYENGKGPPNYAEFGAGSGDVFDYFLVRNWLCLAPERLPNYDYKGSGLCADMNNQYYDYAYVGWFYSQGQCASACESLGMQKYVGFTYDYNWLYLDCFCWFDNGFGWTEYGNGEGRVGYSHYGANNYWYYLCYEYEGYFDYLNLDGAPKSNNTKFVHWTQHSEGIPTPGVFEGREKRVFNSTFDQ